MMCHHGTDGDCARCSHEAMEGSNRRAARANWHAPTPRASKALRTRQPRPDIAGIVARTLEVAPGPFHVGPGVFGEGFSLRAPSGAWVGELAGEETAVFFARARSDVPALAAYALELEAALVAAGFVLDGKEACST